MPPVPEDLVRIHLNFGLGTEELAVATFHLKLDHIPGANTGWPEMVQTAAEKVRDKWIAAHSGTSKGLFPKGVVLRDVAAYHLEAATGHALDKGTAVAAGANAWAGTADISLPLECATAVSLFAYAEGQFLPDRARRRGRMYLPPLSNTVMDSADVAGRMGRLAAGQHTVLTNAMGTFFNDVHRMTVGQDPLDVGQNWDLVVVSRAGNFSSVVTRMAVGDVVDVQRRRRNAQREIYRNVVIADA